MRLPRTSGHVVRRRRAAPWLPLWAAGQLERGPGNAAGAAPELELGIDSNAPEWSCTWTRALCMGDPGRVDDLQARSHFRGFVTRARIGCVDDHRRVRVVEERCRLDNDALRELDRRLAGYREPADLGSGWDRGVPGDWLDDLL